MFKILLQYPLFDLIYVLLNNELTKFAFTTNSIDVTMTSPPKLISSLIMDLARLENKFEPRYVIITYWCFVCAIINLINNEH